MCQNAHSQNSNVIFPQANISPITKSYSLEHNSSLNVDNYALIDDVTTFFTLMDFRFLFSSLTVTVITLMPLCNDGVERNGCLEAIQSDVLFFAKR